MKFSPGIYEHAAALIECSPWEVSRSRDLLLKAHLKAFEEYQHDLIVVGIDVYNIEPEAQGAVVSQPIGNGLPAIAEHPCEEIEELLDLKLPDPADSGRMPMILDAASSIKKKHPEANVFVPVCGPFAYAIGMLGLDELLCALIEDPETSLQALNHLVKIQEPWLEAIKQAGALPFFFESGTSPPLMPPELFQKFEVPALQAIFIKSQEIFRQLPHCIIGGDVLLNLEMFLSLKPGWVICPAETDQQAFVKCAQHFQDTHFRINLPVGILLDNAEFEESEVVKQALNLARSLSNVSIGTGVVPYEASPERLKSLNDYIEGIP